MKVLIATPRAPWVKGGVERVVGETAKRVNKKFSVEILCTDPMGKDIGNYEWESIPVNVVKSYSSFYHFSPQYYRLLRQSISNYDIIHVHNYSSFMPLPLKIVKTDIPIVFNPHFHIDASNHYLSILRELYDPIFGRSIIKSANKIICVSNEEKNNVCKKFGVKSDLVSIIPNGVNVRKIQQAKPFSVNSNIILYIGRLELYKNIQHLISAISHLDDNYHLVIIGKGDYRSILEKQIDRFNLRGKVTIYENLPDDAVYRWINTCTLLINLSNIEAFGITVIEALAANKPVIVNKMGGLAELSTIFPSHIFPVNLSLDSIVDTIKYVAPLHMDVNKINLSHYDWDNISDEILCQYENILLNK